MRFPVLVEVRLRPGIADPAGATIQRALPALGFDGVADVRVGKAIRFTVEAADEDAARKQVDELCERMLANPVIEDTEDDHRRRRRLPRLELRARRGRSPARPRRRGPAGLAR
jgi:phosphoribosylformylglycinamidine synthase